MPTALEHQPPQALGLLSGIVGGLREADHSISRNATLDQVALHQLRDAGIRAQATTASNDSRRPMAVVKLRGAYGPIGVVVVVTQQQNRVRRLRGLVYYQEAAGGAQQRVA